MEVKRLEGYNKDRRIEMMVRSEMDKALKYRKTIDLRTFKDEDRERSKGKNCVAVDATIIPKSEELSY